ncbi:hypothetical protein [Streptomyces oceani]|uniref:Uncharacterized protein n=1 Tax=Streptomyces oceani TaxID=1075402 RepID=A0A1E7KQ11_9ACTN|nr:hypothetical protein [Streptomyces oceani]OEV06020.1 hypothetical protein AN216_00660 [Streptomyces oceani]
MSGPSVVQDPVALAEIELCGELMIEAAAADLAGDERLSVARIDEVLRVAPPGWQDTDALSCARA